MTSAPVDFDGWRERPSAQLTATTGNPEGWNAAYADALAVLGDPSKAPQPATVRALAIGGAIACGWLRGQVVQGEAGTAIVRTDTWATGGARPNGAPAVQERDAAAAILERSLHTILLARCPAPQAAPALPPRMILAPSGTVEAAAPFPWPQVILILAVAGVVAYAVHEAGAVAERWVEERARTTQLEQSHASTAELVRKHAEREREAGHDLPLDEATRLALQGLGAEQQATAARLSPPRNVVNVGDGAALGTVALLLAAAAGAFVFLR